MVGTWRRPHLGKIGPRCGRGLNVLSIRQGRPGWHSFITGAVSPLTECAPIGDRTCPIYRALGRFCQMTHQHKIGYSVEITWDTTEQPTHNLKLLFLCNRPGKYRSPFIESVSTQTNFRKKWQKVPRSPLLHDFSKMPKAITLWPLLVKL